MAQHAPASPGSSTATSSDVLGQPGAAAPHARSPRPPPLIVEGEFPAQMKLDLFMKDLHLIQEAAGELGSPIPLTDVAERLYASVHAAGHGAEDLAVVVKALEDQTPK